MPVKTVSFGDDSVEVYNNPLGSGNVVDASNNVVPDTLHQKGSVGYKVMGFATAIEFDECVLRAEKEISGIYELDVVDSTRDCYAGKYTS